MDKTEEELLRELKELKQAYNSLKAAIETDLLSADNTEKESKMNQIHFHLLFNEMPLGYQSLDFDGYFIEVNQEWLNILGYSRDEVIGKCFSDFLTPIYRDAFSKRFPIFKEKGTIYSEFEMIHKNGTVIFVGFNGKIAYDLNGNFKYTHCFLQDITQSKNAEKALRVSEEKMRSIYSVAPAGIGVVCDRVLKDVNSRVCEMTGYSMEELIDKNARLLYPSQTEFDFVGEEKYNQIREKGTGAVETLWQRKDGSIINVLVSSTPIDRNDYSKGLIFTALDITKRKKAEEDLKETKRLLSESEKLGKVGGWEFNIDTFDQKWTDETFFIHDVDISFDNTIDKGINFYTQESKPIIINAVERAIEFGEPFDLELDIITAKGNLKHVHTIGKADIENRRLFGFFQDITERKNAEEKLNQSMKSYQAIYNSSTDCIFIHDSKTGEIVDVNQTTIDTFGYSREEITQLNVGDFSINIPPYTQKEALEFIQKAVKEGPQFFDWQAKKKNGEIIWLENSLQYIELAGIHRVLVVGRDITERKIIENELNEKTSFLSTIMETSPVGIVTVDKKGNITFANNRAEQILGLAKEKITSTTYDAPLWNHTDVDGSPLPYEKQPFNIVKKTLKTVVDIQHGITWPDGRVVILTINASPILDDRGAFNGMIASIGDITEHKWAEKSLKESEEKYRTLVNSTLQGVIIAKSDPVRLVFANPAMAEICGYSPEELIDMTAGDLTHLVFEEDRPRFFSNFQKRLKGESIAKINEYRLVTKTGVIKWVALYSSVIEYQNEPATLSTFMDVTERKETEEALRRSEKQSAFLAQSAVELVELNSLQEIYKYTVQKLYDLFDGNTIVALVENNNTENRWKMRQVVGLNQNAAAVSKLIGFDINNLEGEISTKYYDKIISGNLTELELDFPGLFNKRLSDAVGKTVKKMFSIEKLYCIAFKQDQNIIGNITFTTNKKTGVVNAQLIEAFIHLVSTVVRKQKAEAKIHEKENEFKKLSANLPDLIYQFTRRPDGSYYVPIASQGITNIFGCQPEDVADNFDAIARVLHPDDVERVITDIEYSAKHLTFFTCEFRVVIPGKPVQWIFSRSTPEKLPDGSITWYGFNANITEYKKTEEELRESKNLFQQISIISKTGGWSVDMITGEHNWTELTREIHEVDPDFVPNMDQAINFYKEGENRKKIADAVSNCVETGEPFDVEVELVTAKGNERWVRSIGSAEYIDGKCVKLIGSIQDISERKKAEEALIESENRFKKLSSFTFEGIIIHNKGIVIDVNQSTLKMLGYKRDEMVGTNLLNAVHPDSHAIVKGNIVKEVAIPYQIVAIREDGSTFDAEIEARYILFNNEFFRVACIRDITERKRSEKIRQLQYNIARATITTRNLQELFDFVKNELNNIIDAKNLFIALYNEETGMIYSPLFKDEKDNYHEWPAEKSTTGYVIKSGQTVHLRREDTLKLVEEGLINIVGSPSEAWLGVPLKVEGKVFGAIVVQSYENPDIFDQTTIEILELVDYELSMFVDRQRAEERANKLSRSVEQSSVSVAITNKKGEIEYVNPFFTKLTGYSFEEVKGKNFRILKSGHHSKAFYKELWDTILSGNDWNGELLNRKKNGELYWAKSIVTPIFNSEGIITNFLSIKEDITELKKMVEELVAAKEKAQESDRLKTAFLNNISHEIRTPLNGILGFSEVLISDDLSADDKQSILEHVQRSSNRLMNTVMDYIDMARIVSGSIEVHKKEFALKPFFEKIVEKTRPFCDSKNISLVVDCQDNLNSTLHSDSELIEKILNHLLDNAVKFSKDGIIKCGYRFQNDSVEFFVEDTGKGIAANKLETIFNIFTQEDYSDTRNHEGSGLGLSISKGLVDLLGGTISAISEVGTGSAFMFTVPCPRPKIVDEAPPAEVQNNVVATKPLIVIAEDEESNYMYLQIVLQKAGCDFLLAKNGKEAVEFCIQHPEIALVLMDIKMPVMSGIEATKRIREFRPHLPIIATTAYVQTGDKQRFIEAGCNGYLPKPIIKETLLALLNNYCKMPLKS